jgi:hypothetical protein
MTIETFAEMTRRVIARDGYDDFLPTACFPGRRQVAALEGVPISVDIECITSAWAARKAKGDEELLVAFKVSADRFNVVRRMGSESDEAVFPVV